MNDKRLNSIRRTNTMSISRTELYLGDPSVKLIAIGLTRRSLTSNPSARQKVYRCSRDERTSFLLMRFIQAMPSDAPMSRWIRNLCVDETSSLKYLFPCTYCISLKNARRIVYRRLRLV